MSLTTPTVGSTPLRHTPSKRTLRTPTPIDSSYLSVSDSRKRQSKKDENIRKRIEKDLAKKRQVHSKSRHQRKGAPGSVLSLKPSEPIVCKPGITVSEASQLMSARRENCILVAEDDGTLSGIFTAKDLAFRVVGAELNASNVMIEEIMTPDPFCARSDMLASDALTLMVTKGFRHLPVLDENNEIVGVLDITKCFYEAMEKLERVMESTRKLNDVFDTVQSEIGGKQPPTQILQYFESLKTIMNAPKLEDVLNGKPPVFVSPRTNVLEASRLMKENKTTAVLVQDQADGEITGIFTSKDVVLRVIANGLDPKLCSVIRVMTPQPDFASKTLSIQAALRKMHVGHYLNLPVIDEDGDVLGVVEVLKLTYATLDAIKSMQTTDSEGPVWNKFWNNLDQAEDSNSESALSNTRSRPSTPLLPVTEDELAQFELGSSNGLDLGLAMSPTSRPLRPSDSISFTGSPLREGPQSSLATSLINPDLQTPFTFKFKAPSSRIYRIAISPSAGIDELRRLIKHKLSKSDLAALGGSDHFAVSYLDHEGDLIAVTDDQDLISAVSSSSKSGKGNGSLLIHHLNESADNISESKNRADTNKKRQDTIEGVPNEALLPGALVILAASIFVVVSLSRRGY